ncbi:MAG: hypothetical protein HQK55_05090 [Deltaproteobacteria bacterium]|nr:hypothetical protein [Deltaproteobacteria bacterium]
MIRTKNEIHPSSEIDGYCTKCKLVTNHRVVAMLDGVIKRVICLTCDSQHNFRPPPGAKKTVTSSPKRVTKDNRRVPAPEGGPPILSRWLELKTAFGEQTEPRPYRMSEAYKEGETLTHSKFGLGFVVKILNQQKMEVIFEREVKTMAMNYSI